MQRLAARSLFALGLSLAACSQSSEPTPSSAAPPITTEPPPVGQEPPPVVDPNAPKLVTLDLGTVAPGKPVTFEAPKGTIGFNVIALPENGTSTAEIAIAELVAPDGKKVVTDSTPEGATYPMSYAGVATTSIPRGPSSVALADRSGTWTVTFDATSPLEASVSFQVTGDGKFHGGELDVHVYIPVGLQIHDPNPMHPVSAATAESDPAVKARLDTYFAALEELFGLGRGKVTFHEIGAEYLTITELNMGSALARTAAAQDGQAMHLVWSSKLVLWENETWGVSPGIPGGAIKVGHAASGIVMGITKDFPAKGDGLTMLHETGHWLGLHHTTELAGGMSDPLKDTPICEGISAQTAKQCADRTNLMFPIFYGATNGGNGVMLSDDQRAVVQGSPIYRARTTKTKSARGPSKEQSGAAFRTFDALGASAIPAHVTPCGEHALR